MLHWSIRYEQSSFAFDVFYLFPILLIVLINISSVLLSSLQVVNATQKIRAEYETLQTIASVRGKAGAVLTNMKNKARGGQGLAINILKCEELHPLPCSVPNHSNLLLFLLSCIILYLHPQGVEDGSLKPLDSAIMYADSMGRLSKLQCQRTSDLAQLRLLGETLGDSCRPTANPDDLTGARKR